MRRFARQLAVAWILGGLACAAGCATVGSEPNGTLRIGTVADAPPLAFRQEGRWRGVEIDLGRALAERLGMKAVFVACPPNRLEDALLDGKVDVLMAGLTLSEERRVHMDFSVPYLVVGQGALVRTADLPRFNTPIKIRAAQGQVGVVAGGTGERFVSRYFAQAGRVAFLTVAEAVAALRQGEIDMVVHDAPALWWLSLRHAPELAVAPALFAREEVAWGFRRSSVALRESANRALADWQQDGTLEAILRRWIPFSK